MRHSAISSFGIQPKASYANLVAAFAERAASRAAPSGDACERASIDVPDATRSSGVAAREADLQRVRADSKGTREHEKQFIARNVVADKAIMQMAHGNDAGDCTHQSGALAAAAKTSAPTSPAGALARFTPMNSPPARAPPNAEFFQSRWFRNASMAQDVDV